MESLRAMFPDLDPDILQAMFVGHDNDLERTIDALLDVGGPQPAPANIPAANSTPVNLPAAELNESQVAADMMEAMRLQEMLDEEVAHEVQRELTAEQAAEQAAEQERRRANSVEARTAAAAKSAASAAALAARSTKSLLARATGAARPCPLACAAGSGMRRCSARWRMMR